MPNYNRLKDLLIGFSRVKFVVIFLLHLSYHGEHVRCTVLAVHRPQFPETIPIILLRDQAHAQLMTRHIPKDLPLFLIATLIFLSIKPIGKTLLLMQVRWCLLLIKLLVDVN